jgi:hypothetical protein
MRNRYPGTCYRCGKHCAAGDGHFEKIPGTRNGWRVQHANCAIKYRGTDHHYEDEHGGHPFSAEAFQ